MTSTSAVNFSQDRANRLGVFIVKSKEGYRFLDKDPIIDLFREALRRSALSLSDVAKESRVSYGTLLNWDKGKTRKPQHATMRAALKACGYNEEFINRKTGHMLRFQA